MDEKYQTGRTEKTERCNQFYLPFSEEDKINILKARESERKLTESDLEEDLNPSNFF